MKTILPNALIVLFLLLGQLPTAAADAFEGPEGSSLNLPPSPQPPSQALPSGIGPHPAVNPGQIEGSAAEPTADARTSDPLDAPLALNLEYTFLAPQIDRAGEYDSVTMEGLPKLGRPGAPRLPIKAANVLLPFAQQVRDVNVTCTEWVTLPGSYFVEPAQQPHPLSQSGPLTPTQPAPEVYQTADPFPDQLSSEPVQQMWRGYQIASLTLYPVEYLPRSGQLSYCARMIVRVETEATPASPAQRLRRQPSQWSADHEVIRTRVDNPEAAASYPSALELGSQALNIASPLDPDTPPYNYVIITDEALMGASGPNNFQALAAAKEARGISTLITTTEWISATYSGLRPDGGEDLQTKIRNFINDAYVTWGIEYVLLGGDGDGADVGGESGDAIIPHRGFYANASGAYIDDDIPADMYYGCLDGTFDDDADGIYGETTDGPGGGEVDLYAEVYVGRAAVDSIAELANFVAKTLAYESEDGAYLRNVWMVGEDLGWTAPWGGDRKDAILTGSTAAGYTTVGFENSPYADFFDTQTLYDRDDPDNNWPKSEIIDVINSPVHLLNHLGHANVTYVMKMGNTDVDTSLTNDHYFIGYSQGCYAGAFDNRLTSSGSYDDDDSISEHLNSGAHGAVAFVSNSRYGWGDGSNPDLGPSQYYDREFWDAVLGEDIPNIARANQDSKEDTYAFLGAGGFYGVMRWVYYELNVFGDPELMIKTGSGSVVYDDHAVDDDDNGASSGNDNGRVDVGETIEMSLTLLSTRPTDVTSVSAQLSTADTYATVTTDVASYDDIAAMGTTTSTTPYVFSVDAACPDDHWITFTLDITGTVNVTGTVETWSDTFYVEVHREPQIEVDPTALSYTLQMGDQFTQTPGLVISNTGEAELTFDLLEIGGSRDILLVDDDSGRSSYSALPYFENALNDLGVSYDLFDTGGGNGPTADQMAGYDIVIWFSGDTWGGTAGPNATDETQLATYLDAGGALFLTSQDYYYDMGLTSFGQTYLGLSSATSDVGHASITGVPGDPIGGGFGTLALSYPGYNYSDDLSPDGTASAAFSGDAGGYAAIDKDGGSYRTVFFGFPWEAIQNNDPANGEAVMQTILNWLAPGDTLWLTEDPITGTAAPDGAQDVDIGWWANVAEVNQPGAYHADLTIQSNDPNTPSLVLPVTMTVEALPTWGQLQGTVTSDHPGGPLAGALVEVISNTTTIISGTTDASGAYGPWWLMNGTYTVTVSDNDYLTDAQAVSIIGQQTTSHHVTLTIDAPQAVAIPSSFEETLFLGERVTRTLTISNFGTQPLDFEIHELPDDFAQPMGALAGDAGQNPPERPADVPAVQVVSSTAEELVLDVHIAGLATSEVQEQGTIYHRFHLPYSGATTEVGRPQLPTFGRFLALPQGAQVEVEVLDSSSETVPDVLVYPAQAPQPDGPTTEQEPPFAIDEPFYAQDTVYPGEIARVDEANRLRGVGVTVVRFYPYQYNPARRELTTYSHLRVRVRFADGTGPFVAQRYRAPSFETLYRRLLLNYDQLGAPQPAAPSDSTTGAELLIITHPDFEAAANTLAAWRNLQGIDTEVRTTVETGATAAEIQAYIQHAYDTWDPVPEFILFLGDAEFVPTNYVNTHPYHGTLTGTDLYYATVDGSDYYADIHTGRISVDTLSEAQGAVEDIIDYDLDPVRDPAFYENASMAAYFQDTDDYDGYEDRRFVLTSEEIRDYLLSQGYTVERIYYTPASVTPTHYNSGTYANGEPLPPELLRANGFAWDGDDNDITAAVNEGRFILNHRDHGATWGWGDPYYDVSRVQALTNDDKLPVVLSMNCQTGWFDNETDDSADGTSLSVIHFSEAWQRNPHGGAVGLMGATRVSYSGYNDWMTEGFYDAIWPDFLAYNEPGFARPEYRMGAVLNYGKLAMEALWGDAWGLQQLEFELFHYFGDPTTSIHIAPPDDPEVPWLSEDPIADTVSAGSGFTVDVAFDTMTYTVGTYTATLLIETNDPVSPFIDIPVTLHIEDVPYDVEIAPPTAALADAPGSLVTYTLTVTNTGTTTDTFDLTASGNVWTTTLPATVGPLTAGVGDEVEVTVEVPTTAIDGDDDTVTISATSQGYSARSDDSMLTTTAAVPCVPVAGADFSFVPTGPEAEEMVTFTGSVTTGTLPITYTWDFGDGTASGQMVTHTFPLSDVYPVVMTATNPCGHAVVTHDVTVTGEPDITVTPLELSAELIAGEMTTQAVTIGNVGTADLTWSLTEVSAASWLSEAPTSGTLAPSGDTPVDVVFDASGLSEGVYATTLQVASDDPDQPQIDVSVTLTVTPPCVPVDGVDFSFVPTAPEAGEIVTFTGSVTTGTLPITFTWDLGDGTATGQVVTHTFPVSDVYPVVMTATNACGQTVATHDVTVTETYSIYLPAVMQSYP